jgi:hypothetical protein
MPMRQRKGGSAGFQQTVTVTLGGAVTSLTSKKNAAKVPRCSSPPLPLCVGRVSANSERAGQGAVASLSSKKAMGVKMEGRLGKKLHGNDLRLRLGGGGGQLASKATAQKVTFEPDVESAEQADGDRWANDMYFKSGQATMAAPLRQAVTERPPSFLTTKGGSRRGAPSAGAARALASAGILVLCVLSGASGQPADAGGICQPVMACKVVRP